MQRDLPRFVVDTTGEPRRIVSIDEDIWIVESANGGELRIRADVLTPDGEGARLDGRWGDLERVIPIVEEEVRVGRQTVERVVRLHKRVIEEERIVEEPLVSEQIDVKVVPVDRFVDRPPEVRREGDVLIVPRVEEVLVVEKRLRVVEEVHVRTVRSVRREQQRVVVRREELDLERDRDPVDREPGTHSDTVHRRGLAPRLPNSRRNR